MAVKLPAPIAPRVMEHSVVAKWPRKGTIHAAFEAHWKDGDDTAHVQIELAVRGAISPHGTGWDMTRWDLDLVADEAYRYAQRGFTVTHYETESTDGEFWF